MWWGRDSVPEVVLAACSLIVCIRIVNANCSGSRRVLNGTVEGYISDGDKAYEANSHCEWLIEGKTLLGQFLSKLLYNLNNLCSNDRKFFKKICKFKNFIIRTSKNRQRI
jgi:hypothetical protein